LVKTGDDYIVLLGTRRRFNSGAFREASHHDMKQLLFQSSNHFRIREKIRAAFASCPITSWSFLSRDINSKFGRAILICGLSSKSRPTIVLCKANNSPTGRDIVPS